MIFEDSVAQPYGATDGMMFNGFTDAMAGYPHADGETLPDILAAAAQPDIDDPTYIVYEDDEFVLDELVVTGDPTGYNPFWPGWSGGGGVGHTTTGGGGSEPPQGEEDDCNCQCHESAEREIAPNGNAVPDNARYFVPASVNEASIQNAIQHLLEFSAVPEFRGVDQYPMSDRMVEFKNMYENINHPYFLDFKDLGRERYTYYSEALGETVNAGRYEAFGNFVYGFIGTMVGFPPEVLRFAANVYQEGSGSGAEDAPHVELGRLYAEQVKLTGGAFFSPTGDSDDEECCDDADG